MKSILLPGSDKTNASIHKRLFFEAVVGRILSHPPGSIGRWKAIRAAWYGLEPRAKEDHLSAIQEARDCRKSLYDTKRGATKATLGIAHGLKSNKNASQFLVAVLPSTLKSWLIRFDPLFLNNHKDKTASKKHWEQVYKTFPEYRVTEKLMGDK